MNALTLKTTSIVLVIASVLLGIFFLKPYLVTIAAAMVLAITIQPLYTRLYTQKPHAALALTGTWVLTFLFIFLPLTLIAQLVIGALNDLLQGGGGSSLLVGDFFERCVDVVNLLHQRFSFIPEVNVEGVIATTKDLLVQWVGGGVESAAALGGSLANTVVTLFIVGSVTSALLVHHEKITQFFYVISPLSNTEDHLLAKRLQAMTLSMVRGTLVVSVIQGLASMLIYFLVGAPYAALWGVLIVIASFIPLANTLVMLGVALLTAASGSLFGALIIVAFHVVVVTNLDNFIRPRLVSHEARLHPALVLLGIFAGLYHFGFLGVIFGPVIMIFIATSFEVYAILREGGEFLE